MGRVAMGLVSILLLSETGCFIKEKPVEQHQVGMFDYCAQSTSPVDKYISENEGTLVPMFEAPKVQTPEPLIQGKITLHRTPNPTKYQVVIVPVGYEDASASLSPLVKTLERAYEGLPIEFSYLARTNGVDVLRLERFATVDYKQAEELRTQLRKVMPVHSIVFALNTTEYVGSALTTKQIATFAAENELSDYIAIHEIGHSLGLGDGYQRFYGKELKDNGINTELFTDIRYLPAEVQQAYKKIKPHIKQVGVCRGKDVFAFVGPNIMGAEEPFSITEEHLRSGKLFTPLQREVIAIRIQQALQR